MIRHRIKLSISRKFMLAVLATTCTALLVAGAALLAFEIQDYRTTWTSDLIGQAEILAQTSVPALEFNDPEAANQNLAQLRARPKVYAAAIYGLDDQLFASYANGSKNLAGIPDRPPVKDSAIDGNQITVTHNIMRDGQVLGRIFVGATYPLSERIARYMAILGAVMMGSLLVAALVSFRLQRAVTRPIRAVTEAVYGVIQRRDFSHHVEKSTEDEVGVLVDAFNSMLTEVGDRTRALEESNSALQQALKERLNAELALQDLNDNLEARIATRTDELARANQLLQQSQKLEAIGQLTGGVAHDFNNVLQVINGNLQLLQPSVAGNQTAQKRLETAAFAADRGAKLSAQLLAFARRQPLQPVPTNLGRVLREMDDLLRRSLGAMIEMETVVAGGLWNALVDPNQLENVILNLAINASDAMPQGGKLTLELGNAMLDDNYVAHESEVTAGQYVMFAISDTGTGMSADTIARVFEPFFTTKREGEGTGLGLSMAYGFVKQSNGHIKIYSEIGSGTTVKIYLPRERQPEVLIVDNGMNPVVGGTETILVVEDDATVQATAVDMLIDLGYVVLKAHDGESALNILRSGAAVDMVFTDVVMPGAVRSPDLARQAKQMFPNIEVLFTSGYTQNAIVHGGRLDPGVELISKPYRREDLARKLRQLLDPHRPAAVQRVAAPTASTATESQELGPRGLSVLVVEDNQDMQLLACELMSMLGHHPQGACDAEQALIKLRAQRFDALFTDVSLPGMSGIDLADIATTEFPDLNVVFSSGFGPVDIADLKFKATSLPKPYDLKALHKVLADIAINQES